jgi:hypothetical protein
MRARAISVNFACAQQFFVFSSLVLLFQSRFFLRRHKNKIQIFSCRSGGRFLISSRWQGEKAVNVNKM